MAAEMKAHWVAEALAGQGVALDAERARAHAALLTTLLGGTAQACARLAFEEEPAAFTVAQRRNAP